MRFSALLALQQITWIWTDNLLFQAVWVRTAVGLNNPFLTPPAYLFDLLLELKSDTLKHFIRLSCLKVK